MVHLISRSDNRAGRPIQHTPAGEEYDSSRY
jgi:hypothetical protein